MFHRKFFAIFTMLAILTSNLLFVSSALALSASEDIESSAKGDVLAIAPSPEGDFAHVLFLEEDGPGFDLNYDMYDISAGAFQGEVKLWDLPSDIENGGKVFLDAEIALNMDGEPLVAMAHLDAGFTVDLHFIDSTDATPTTSGEWNTAEVIANNSDDYQPDVALVAPHAGPDEGDYLLYAIGSGGAAIPGIVEFEYPTGGANFGSPVSMQAGSNDVADKIEAVASHDGAIHVVTASNPDDANNVDSHVDLLIDPDADGTFAFYDGVYEFFAENEEGDYENIHLDMEIDASGDVFLMAAVDESGGNLDSIEFSEIAANGTLSMGEVDSGTNMLDGQIPDLDIHGLIPSVAYGDASTDKIKVRQATNANRDDWSSNETEIDTGVTFDDNESNRTMIVRDRSNTDRLTIANSRTLSNTNEELSFYVATGMPSQPSFDLSQLSGAGARNPEMMRFITASNFSNIGNNLLDDLVFSELDETVFRATTGGQIAAFTADQCQELSADQADDLAWEAMDSMPTACLNGMADAAKAALNNLQIGNISNAQFSANAAKLGNLHTVHGGQLAQYIADNDGTDLSTLLSADRLNELGGDAICNALNDAGAVTDNTTMLRARAPHQISCISEDFLDELNAGDSFTPKKIDDYGSDLIIRDFSGNPLSGTRIDASGSNVSERYNFAAFNKDIGGTEVPSLAFNVDADPTSTPIEHQVFYLDSAHEVEASTVDDIEKVYIMHNQRPSASSMFRKNGDGDLEIHTSVDSEFISYQSDGDLIISEDHDEYNKKLGQNSTKFYTYDGVFTIDDAESGSMIRLEGGYAEQGQADSYSSTGVITFDKDHSGVSESGGVWTIDLSDSQVSYEAYATGPEAGTDYPKIPSPKMVPILLKPGDTTAYLWDHPEADMVDIDAADGNKNQHALSVSASDCAAGSSTRYGFVSMMIDGSTGAEVTDWSARNTDNNHYCYLGSLYSGGEGGGGGGGGAVPEFSTYVYLATLMFAMYFMKTRMPQITHTMSSLMAAFARAFRRERKLGLVRALAYKVLSAFRF